jgi:hypothetical protein
MRHTRDIHRDAWPGFLAGLTRALAGHPVRVETLCGEPGDQHVGHRLTLRALELHAAGPHAGAVRIALGEGAMTFEHHTDVIERISVIESAAGEVSCIDLGGHGGAKTLVLVEGPPWKAAEGAAPEQERASAPGAP